MVLVKTRARQQKDTLIVRCFRFVFLSASKLLLAIKSWDSTTTTSLRITISRRQKPRQQATKQPLRIMILFLALNSVVLTKRQLHRKLSRCRVLAQDVFGSGNWTEIP